MRFWKAIIINIILAGLVTLPTFGQGPSGPGDPGCDPLDPLCPIDGGLSLLIAAGIGLGAKKAYNANAKREKNCEF